MELPHEDLLAQGSAPSGNPKRKRKGFQVVDHKEPKRLRTNSRSSVTARTNEEESAQLPSTVRRSSRIQQNKKKREREQEERDREARERERLPACSSQKVRSNSSHPSKARYSPVIASNNTSEFPHLSGWIPAAGIASYDTACSHKQPIATAQSSAAKLYSSAAALGSDQASALQGQRSHGSSSLVFPTPEGHSTGVAGEDRKESYPATKKTTTAECGPASDARANKEETERGGGGDSPKGRAKCGAHRRPVASVAGGRGVRGRSTAADPTARGGAKRSQPQALLECPPVAKRQKIEPGSVGGSPESHRKRRSAGRGRAGQAISSQTPRDTGTDSEQSVSPRRERRSEEGRTKRLRRSPSKGSPRGDKLPGSPSRAKQTRGRRERKSGGSSAESLSARRKGRGQASSPARGSGGVGSGKGRGQSKGKGRAGVDNHTHSKRTEAKSLSLPPFAEFARLAMASDDGTPIQVPPEHPGGGRGEGESGEGGAGEGSIHPLDPFFVMSEEGRRLHAMLEARGLPPHLLGALGSKVTHVLQKSSNTNNSRAQQLLSGLESMDDESVQLHSCMEMCQLLVMGNEDTLAGFPVKQAVPALMNLLSMEHNLDMMLTASRALTYMLEALPRSSVVVVEAVPLLIERLQVIQCMDVAEQSLSALEILSRRHGRAILQAGGLSACLLYLDFFSLATQRRALSVAANCCQSVTEEDFALVSSALPVLATHLQDQDKRSESCCLCFSRLVENFSGLPAVLQEVASSGLLPNLQQLLVVSPPVISSSTFVAVLRMLSSLSSSCPPIAVQLLKLGMADTLRYLLVGSGEITLENLELVSRSPGEVYEILSVASELMPPLPKDGIFEVEEMLHSRSHLPSMIQWQWQDDAGRWRPYGRMENRIIECAHLASEDECTIAVHGNTYTIDMGSMQQINDDTGTARMVQRSVVEPCPPKKSGQEVKTSPHEEQEDARGLALAAEPVMGQSFVEALFAVLYEVLNSVAGSEVRNRCLKTILRVLYHADAEVLKQVLKDIAVSSHIATMLKSQDYRTIIGGLQMADVLMQKLPDIFAIYFHREGVIHQMKGLRDIPLKALTTPKKQEEAPPTATPPSSVASEGGAAGSESPQTPNSTRKRLSDIFRRGRRHLRRSFTRGHSEDEQSHSQPPLLPHPHSHPHPRPLSHPHHLPPHLHFLHPHDPGPPGPMPGRHFPNMGMGSDMPGAGVGSGGGTNIKECIQQWIRKQSEQFIERWCGPDIDQNPALEVVKRLAEVATQLDVSSPLCGSALRTLCDILLDPASNVSSFEFMHCNLPAKLMSFLTADDSSCAVPRNTRLRQFLHIFVGLPERSLSLDTWAPPQSMGLLPLLQRLHGCVNQLEQFTVKVHDLPGRRGSQALRFFNTHQIKCTLERHPSSPHTGHWKGGLLRIDPLATVQTLERYMLLKGFGKPDHSSHRVEEFDTDDSEVDDPTLLSMQGAISDRHQIEFLIGDQVLPYTMTVFQAVRLQSGAMETDEDSMPLGRPDVWLRTHTVYYRVLPSSMDCEVAGPSSSLSASLPPAPLLLPPHPPSLLAVEAGSRKHSWSSAAARRRTVPTKFLPSPTPPPPFARVTRSSSQRERELAVIGRSSSDPAPTSSWATPTKARQGRTVVSSLSSSQLDSSGGRGDSAGETGTRLSPLQQALRQSPVAPPDPSLPVIRLISVLHALNQHWTDLYHGVAASPVLNPTDFINSKLTAKASRQVQDPFNVMTGSFPLWLRELSKSCPFLFTFECRQMLFHLTSFDRDRAIARLQEQQPELSADESSQMMPRFDKKKLCVSRDNLLEQAEKMMNDLANTRALLEVHYEDEVGTGLGPTLEFYTLVSRELQRADLLLWRGDPCPMPGAYQGASGSPQYVSSPTGLFPMPLGPSTRFSIVEEVCSKFKFLGKFMAKAIVDSRMLDLPLSEAFYKWLLGQENTFTAQDLQYVDPIVAQSFAQLAAVAVKKHTLESDTMLSGKALAVGVESLTLEGGGVIDDLDLDFTLPGYPDINLKPGGRDIPVTIHNLDEYLKLVVDWTLVRGVARQMEAFKEGLNSVFPLSHLAFFYPSEMDMLLCGAHHQKWDIRELVECCRPDHGYTADSRAVQFLFELLSTYSDSEQRQFVQFVTGSPRLPVGGFKALNPPLTVVRKTVEPPQNPDHFLPSVMTCVNYLKLPDYSSVVVMRAKLRFAFQEGKHSFHLS